ncbi:uncharacterized protein B0H64DRAFT_15904 [Chaetomium fimeti]|uniref:Uncharacterized protein n=1 Tax=Chaetomium fimeti TaxID=1854472 RepID=A0AAE0HPR2_9PEZI|nr:hypothetical protein B0H64DRAFT_15904 [Chaetomium fimeti]
MSATATDLTVGNLSGSPIIFYPAPTPWPSSAGCEKNIYRQADGGSILAWDPVYANRFGLKEARGCHAPQVSAWWWQNRQPVTAFGPTFVCPEAYSAVYTSTLDSISAVPTQFTYCCPSNYNLGAVFQPTQKTMLQCTSKAGPGATISYMTRTSLTRKVTITGVDGTVVQPTVLSTNIPTSTVVRLSPATVYGLPVNGFNIGQRQASSTGGASNTVTPPLSPTGALSPTDALSTTDVLSPTDVLSTTDTPTQSRGPGLTPAAIAGIVVGAVIAVGLLALGTFFLGRRWAANRRRAAAEEEDPIKDYYHYLQTPKEAEMPIKHHILELPANKSVQELPTSK